MRTILLSLSLVTCLFWNAAVHAADPDERLADPLLEARAQEIGAQLRCVVCKSQSIEASDAPLARDLRILVRERLSAGESDAAILDYVAERYGAYVLLKPPVQGNTLVLWLAPAALLLLCGIAATLVLRGRTTSPAVAPLSADEAAALAALEKTAADTDTNGADAAR
ncbi:MAG: cytochrome c-type biogenesis protein [Pseudomonadota bacterium]